MRPLKQDIARPRNARQGRFITTADAEFGFSPICALAATTISGSWASANDPVGVPFRLSEALVVTHLGWRNGSAAGSNHDIGIYDANWNLLVSTGSIGPAAASSLWNIVDVTDTPIPAGRYYLTYVVNATTANRARYWSISSSLVLTTMMGLKETATDSFPLPSTLGSMGDPVTITRVPILCFGVKGQLA